MTEEKRKELLDQLKNVTEKDYYPGSKYQKGDAENWHYDADCILCELFRNCIKIF